MEEVIMVGIFFDGTISLTKHFIGALKATSLFTPVNLSKIDFKNLYRSKGPKQPKIKGKVISRVVDISVYFKKLSEVLNNVLMKERKS